MDTYTQLYVFYFEYLFLVPKAAKFYEILRNAFYIRRIITKFGLFWSEIRNEIWSISNEIQAKANFHPPGAARLQ